MSRQLIIQGFVQSHGDPCLYVKTYGNGITLDITLYVDNIFATTDAGELADADLKELNKLFTGTLQENPSSSSASTSSILGSAASSSRVRHTSTPSRGASLRR